jgi:hypothetical protein
MKRTIPLILGLLIAITAPCQSKKERKKNRIKSTTEWETALVDGKTATFRVSYEEFDKAGRPVMRVDYAPDGSVIFKTTVVFNSFGDKTEETEFDPAKKKNLRLTYRYNALRDKTEEVEYDGAGALLKKTTFTYDAGGNRISETETDAAGKLLKKSVYSYNAKNLKTGKTNVAGSKLNEKSKKWDYVYY